MDGTWYLPNLWAVLLQQPKPDIATPMCGLQTLTHGVNMQKFFFLLFKNVTLFHCLEHVFIVGHFRFFTLTQMSLLFQLFHKITVLGRNESTCPLRAACVWRKQAGPLWLALPHLALPTAILCHPHQQAPFCEGQPR